MTHIKIIFGDDGSQIIVRDRTPPTPDRPHAAGRRGRGGDCGGGAGVAWEQPATPLTCLAPNIAFIINTIPAPS